MNSVSIIGNRPDSLEAAPEVPILDACLARLAADPSRIETLPFSAGDATAGTETELQTAVIGNQDTVDLPVILKNSSYVSDLLRRITAGDVAAHTLKDVRRYLAHNPDNVWEHSWVRIPARTLHPDTRRVIDDDLRHKKGDTRVTPVDAGNGAGTIGAAGECTGKAVRQGIVPGYRGDAYRFFGIEAGEEYVRVPVSYIMKLALADSFAVFGGGEPILFRTTQQVVRCFLNDNTSPETSSFHIVAPAKGNLGLETARETSKRFLLTQLLVQYANKRFELEKRGQKSVVYFSPHPPIRQRLLNDFVPDAVYRDLFMSPCLSGWDCGESKHQYMILCHQVLSRSHLNAVAKLREAGIVGNNLVVLPNTSNVSLANNGVHVSLGSRKLGRLLAGSDGMTKVHEKYLGDLAIKIQEHFLPLFAGTYSAAPYHLGFADFHPEQVLGFLPHELDYTHLRMIWRRWKRKARNSVLGYSVTPFGPALLDEALRFLFRLKGDLVADFRLVDYPAALLSTHRSGALDGRLDNQDRLKTDLDEAGIFDRRMSLYLPVKLREYHRLGFSGFELRTHSLFGSLRHDLAHAVDLQMLICALAFKFMAERRYDHGDVPDDPNIESERRQIFFGAAIGIPTFYVKKDTPNRFLAYVLEHTSRVRHSRRYPGYLRVYNQEYRRALVRILRKDGAELIEMLGLESMVEDLTDRTDRPDENTAHRVLTRRIRQAGGSKDSQFNEAAERFYRGILRQDHLREAVEFLAEDCRRLDAGRYLDFPGVRALCRRILGDRRAGDVLDQLVPGLLDESLASASIARLIQLILLMVHIDTLRSEATGTERDTDGQGEACRPCTSTSIGAMDGS